METTVSSKGQIVLPAAARKRLRLVQGERLTVELREGRVFFRPVSTARSYRLSTDPLTGLPGMKATTRGGRKVTAAEVARLNAELL